MLTFVSRVPPGKVHSVEPDAASSGNQHSFGPYTDVAPHSHKSVHIHYENVGAPLSASVKRVLEVSHWGSRCEVMDEWDLNNFGPRLKKPFSRIDFSRSAMYQQGSTAVNNVAFTLPKHARDAYFRDFDGNVSWSHFRSEAGKSILEIRPRFPIYGGWHYHWMQGYDLPLHGDAPLLKYDKKSGRYVFQAKFADGIKNVPISRLRLEVILPEGSQYVVLRVN
jgi:oligosaccharyltransferase complex subunit alpha (ribophorin I)